MPARHLLQADLGPELKTAFLALCQQADETPSELLRKMVRHILDRNPDARSAVAPAGEAPPAPSVDADAKPIAPLTPHPTTPDTGTHRLELRLRNSEMAALTERAERAGDSVQRHIVAILREHLTHVPHLGSAALTHIADSNYQLATVSSTLNQLLRALGPGQGQGPKKEGGQGIGLTAKELATLRDRIDTHTESVQLFIAAQHTRGVLRAP